LKSGVAAAAQGAGSVAENVEFYVTLVLDWRCKSVFKEGCPSLFGD
jgi:hypothetical protein